MKPSGRGTRALANKLSTHFGAALMRYEENARKYREGYGSCTARIGLKLLPKANAGELHLIAEAISPATTYKSQGVSLSGGAKKKPPAVDLSMLNPYGDGIHIAVSSGLRQGSGTGFAFRFTHKSSTVEIQKEIGTWTTSRRRIFRTPS